MNPLLKQKYSCLCLFVQILTKERSEEAKGEFTASSGAL